MLLLGADFAICVRMAPGLRAADCRRPSESRSRPRRSPGGAHKGLGLRVTCLRNEIETRSVKGLVRKAQRFQGAGILGLQVECFPLGCSLYTRQYAPTSYCHSPPNKRGTTHRNI